MSIRFTYLRSIIIFFCLLLIQADLFGQRKASIDYVAIGGEVYGGNSPEAPKDSKWYFFASTLDYAVWEFKNIYNARMADKREQQRLENERKQSMAKLSIISAEYAEFESYPETIIDGWHHAVATDKSNFCKDVKVLVAENRIVKLVVDDYLPLNFTATRSIKNGKNVVSLRSFNGEDLSIVEIFFLYDLEEPTLTDPPQEPAFVCFWSDMKNFADIKITFDGRRLEAISVNYPKQPDPFANGTVSRIMKPGTYSYVALGKGAIDWKGTFEVKAGECAMVRFGR